MPSKELQVINSVLANKDIGILFGEAVDDLFVAYKDVWSSIKQYYNRHHSIPDIEVIQERFPDLDSVPVRAATAYYLDGLREEFIRNEIEVLLTRADNALRSDSSVRVMDKLQGELARLNRVSATSRDLDIMDWEDAERHYEEVRARAAARGGVPGIPTGVGFFDSAYTTGLSGGDLVVVLGWTGRKKSLFTTLICCNAHSMGHKPMIVSLEMTGEKVRDRAYTIMNSGRFSNSHLSLGDVSLDDFNIFRKEKENAPNFIVVSSDGSTNLTPNVVQAKIDQHKPSIVVYDYAQLGFDNQLSNDMVSRMRNMSSEFKRLAVNNDIPVVLISSATPENSSSADEPPIIEQVAWSKQLSFDADLAVAVHGHNDSDLVEIVGRKNRNGPLFSGYLDWNVDRGVVTEKFNI